MRSRISDIQRLKYVKTDFIFHIQANKLTTLYRTKLLNSTIDSYQRTLQSVESILPFSRNPFYSLPCIYIRKSDLSNSASIHINLNVFSVDYVAATGKECLWLAWPAAVLWSFLWCFRQKSTMTAQRKTASDLIHKTDLISKFPVISMFQGRLQAVMLSLNWTPRPPYRAETRARWTARSREVARDVYLSVNSLRSIRQEALPHVRSHKSRVISTDYLFVCRYVCTYCSREFDEEPRRGLQRKVYKERCIEWDVEKNLIIHLSKI